MLARLRATDVRCCRRASAFCPHLHNRFKTCGTLFSDVEWTGHRFCTGDSYYVSWLNQIQAGAVNNPLYSRIDSRDTSCGEVVGHPSRSRAAGCAILQLRRMSFSAVGRAHNSYRHKMLCGLSRLEGGRGAPPLSPTLELLPPASCQRHALRHFTTQDSARLSRLTLFLAVHGWKYGSQIFYLIGIYKPLWLTTS